MASEPKSCVSNETNKRLSIHAADGRTLTLSPLEREREVSLEDKEAFRLEEYERQGYVALFKDVSASVRVWPLIAILCGWASLLITVIGVVGGRGAMYWLGGACTVLGLFCLGVLLRLCCGARFHKLLTKRLVDSARQQLSFLMAVGTAVLIPSILLLFSTGLWERITGEGTSGQADPSNFYVELACRLLHLLFISVISLLPALLFFVLDRECMSTLRNRFTRQIFRFDPEVTNKRDIRAKYGSLLNEAYGIEGVSSFGRVLAARRSPVLVATLVITIGWSVTFLSGPSPEHSTIQALLASFFAPHRSALIFGFLGSYFYALQTAFRSYVYRDLRPKAYSHITIRIVSTMILAWVLSLLDGTLQPQQSGVRLSLLDGPPLSLLESPPLSLLDGTTASPTWLLVLVFVTGIVPETALVRLREFVRDSVPGRLRGTKESGPSLVDEHEPLTNLDGIDLYDRSRLLDEGVTNVQSLAHHDVVELMILTRISVPRLLDWVDQAILHLHVSKGDSAKKTRALLARLQEYGIRTATDLQNACESRQLKKELELIFSSKGEGHLESILRSLKNAEWMRNLHYWNQRRPVEELILPSSGAYLHALSSEPREEELSDAREALPH
ncbi:hypothetical protein ACLESO_21055 [Pyxidicoccus sp. 3LG]